MIHRTPFWKRPIWMLLLIVLAVGAGGWPAMGRPLPVEWSEGDSPIRLPEGLRRSEPVRLFCAESPETGVCRCITADGARPEISESECRRRARGSETRAGSDY